MPTSRTVTEEAFYTYQGRKVGLRQVITRGQFDPHPNQSLIAFRLSTSPHENAKQVWEQLQHELHPIAVPVTWSSEVTILACFEAREWAMNQDGETNEQEAFFRELDRRLMLLDCALRLTQPTVETNHASVVELFDRFLALILDVVDESTFRRACERRLRHFE